MPSNRRDFLKGAGASAALIFTSRDLISDILATSPKGRVLETRFKGMADIVLMEAKRAGASYADVRFTLTSNLGGASANFNAGGTGGGGRGGAVEEAAAGLAGSDAGVAAAGHDGHPGGCRPASGWLRRARHPQRCLGFCLQPDRDRG